MRLVDADAYAEEMKKRQDACKEWTQRTIDTEENYLRSCGAYVVFVEAKLLLEKQPTIDAIPIDYIMQRADALIETNVYGAKVLYGLVMIWNGEEQNDADN